MTATIWAASSSSVGVTWLQIPSVIAIVACPRRSWTTRGWSTSQSSSAPNTSATTSAPQPGPVARSPQTYACQRRRSHSSRPACFVKCTSATRSSSTGSSRLPGSGALAIPPVAEAPLRAGLPPHRLSGGILESTPGVHPVCPPPAPRKVSLLLPTPLLPNEVRPDPDCPRRRVRDSDRG